MLSWAYAWKNDGATLDMKLASFAMDTQDNLVSGCGMGELEPQVAFRMERIRAHYGMSGYFIFAVQV